MEFPLLEEHSQQEIPEAGLPSFQHAASRNFTIDPRDTCWFLEREEDVLAGYLFTQDDEMRERSD